MMEYHKLARNIALKTYQEKLFEGGIPQDKKFRAQMQDLAHRDEVRGYILFAGETPVSYLYLPIADKILTYEYLGYDPAYSGSSPGTVLLYLALDSLFQEGSYRYFDFGYGENQTKQVFSTANFLRADIYFFPRTVANYLTIYGHAGFDSFSAGFGKIFERLHLKQRIKMAMRSKTLV
jgi:CelD/BcsL family acetyltransferase involved in cellulose biosynthesis